jgi:hypothetical protein
MTTDAKVHRMVDDALCDGHLFDISVTRGAWDFSTDVRRMIEPHVSFFDESVYPLPRQVLAALGVVSEGLDSGVRLVADILVTTHADVDAGNAGNRTPFDSRMTIRAADTDIKRMNVMRKFDGLPGRGLDVKEVPGSFSDTVVRGTESWRTPPPSLVGVRRLARITRNVRLRHASENNSGDRHN